MRDYSLKCLRVDVHNFALTLYNATMFLRNVLRIRVRIFNPSGTKYTTSYKYIVLNLKCNLKCKRTCIELRGQVSGCCGVHILFSSRLSLIFLPTMVSFDQSSPVGGGCAINVAWLIPDPVARSAPPCTPPTVY